MIAKIVVRSIATLTCLAVMATGWDAEAAGRRRCRTSCCYYEPVCCEPVYTTVCAPACSTACAPACSTCCVTSVRPSWVVQETVIVPATTCCAATSTTAADTVAAAQVPTVTGEAQTARKTAVTKVTSTSLQR